MPLCPDRQEIFQQLQMLLPPGRAWQTTDQNDGTGSLIGKFMFALSAEVWRMDQGACETFAEIFCHSSVEDIEWWMTEYGLPDRCDPFGEDVCAKVATVGEEGGSTEYLQSIADRLGWNVILDWLKGGHPDFPGVRSTLLLEIDEENSPAALVTDFDNWEFPNSAFGDIGATDIEGLTCTYEHVLPAHIGFEWRTILVTMLRAVELHDLETGLELALDAGDEDSYAGTGQQWSDTSGDANHYNRGTTSGAEGTDPTFNGVANARSAAEFFSFDGDYFTSTGSPTFGPTFHKNNAIFTIAIILKPVNLVTTQQICGTLNAGTGFQVLLTATGNVALVVKNAGAAVISQPAVAPATGQFRFIAISVDEALGAAGGFFQIGETVTTFDATYTSPSAGAADGNFKIGAAPDGSTLLVSGSQIAAIAVWNGVALTQPDVSALRRTLRNRWPTI